MGGFCGNQGCGIDCYCPECDPQEFHSEESILRLKRLEQQLAAVVADWAALKLEAMHDEDRLTDERDHSREERDAAMALLGSNTLKLEAVTADLTATRGEVSHLEDCNRKLVQTVEAVTAERDGFREGSRAILRQAEAAEAQVAALREVVSELADTADHLVRKAGDDWDRLGGMAHEALATPSPAADRLLAAQAVAEAVDWHWRTEFDEFYRLTTAMDAWRDANLAQKET